MNRLKTSCFDLVVGDWIWWYINLIPYPILILKIEDLRMSKIKITALSKDGQVFEAECYNAYRLIDVATPPI